MLIAISAAVVGGGVGGGLAALYSSPGSPPETPHAPPPAEPVAGHLAPPASPAAPGSAVTAPPDPKVQLAMQMKTVLSRFGTWSRDHAGAPCPDGATLGGVVLDPWGHPIELTCTAQPAEQVVGAISAGPDGIAGNDDDVMSWTLGPEVTNLAHGTRWRSTPAATASPAATQAPAPPRKGEHSGVRDHGPTRPPLSAGPPSSKSTKPSALPGDAGADDIPARR